MAKELIINASLPEVRIALLEDGRIQELLIERASEKGIVGNIYKGKVTRVLPGMQAAFVDIGLDKAAFLYVDDIYVHPKVMGEETEMDSDEGQSDDEVSESDAEGSSDTLQSADASGSEDSALEGASEGVIPSSEEMSATSEETFEDESIEMQAAEEAAHASFEEPSAQETAEEFSDFSEEGSDESNEDSGDESGDSSDDLENDSNDEADFAEGEENEIEGEELAEGESQGQEGGFVTPEGTGGEVQASAEGEAGAAPLAGLAQQGQGRRNNRRGRNRNRNRRGKGGQNKNRFAGGESHDDPNFIPDSMTEQLADQGHVESDRAAVAGEGQKTSPSSGGGAGRQSRQRPEFREQRNRDRRIKSKNLRPRAQANIADLLSEGQEVIVQVAKDPIATKGARLTCHVSLPGRHLVCMPSIDHVGVSRRIERDDERRRLRDFVEKNRPKKMGFIVRTASGGKDPESWIKQDIDYLSKLWKGIRNRADNAPPASLVYEDLNSVLRAIRDWVNEDISKIVVDSRYHYNELLEFAERFMPSLEGKIELYHGDIPIFDAYSLSAELNRSLERKVWLKSGGYIVIDQAEALVAVDVNTGRFVGKTNLEATILKTNLEAAEEIAYQLRLRNCGGIIIVDFIDMERDENKMRVYRALDEALKKDRARPTIQKISELGLVEMPRKRTRDTLVRSLCEPCTHCEGRSYIKGARTVAYEILREIERLGVDREAKKILISAHETVVDLLAIDLREVLDTLEKRYNKQVYIQAILDFHNEQFEVVTDRMQGRKQNNDIARQLRIERDRSDRKEKQKQRQKESRDHRDQNRDRDENRNSGSEEATPEAPRPRPSGSFIVKPKPAAEDAGVEALEGESQVSENSFEGADDQGEDQMNQQNHQPRQQPRHQPRMPQNTEDMDEDQLAYLRAQAAQDAAIASLSQDGGGPGQQKNQNQRHGRNQNQNNNRNQNQRGGRHQNNRNQRGGQGGHGNSGGGQHRNQKFRPRHPGGQPGNQASDNRGNMMMNDSQPSQHQVPSAPSTPDYEVLVKPEGDGSNS